MHSDLNCHNVAQHRGLPGIVMINESPIRKKSRRVRSGERGGHYRYRVSGHAPTVPYSTVRRR
jgi:hypothetical protein